jgi:ADP-ribose pyrophosphatase
MHQWEVAFPGYAPQEYTAKVVLDGPSWADPQHVPAEELAKRVTYSMGGKSLTLAAAGLIGPDGLPRNPAGRTGTVGRGLLGLFGSNQAGDSALTRVKPGSPGTVQIALIKRKDTGDWALPGGMVEAGTTCSATRLQEFLEEALSAIEGNESLTKHTLKQLKRLFRSGGVPIYRGYVRDPRNTDHAWMESTVYWYHATDPAVVSMPLKAGDDANAVAWVDMTPGMKLYASHADWVEEIRNRMSMKPRTRASYTS